MEKAPRWYGIVCALALLWNLAGLAAVVADLRLTPADVAALPAAQQAMVAARPGWSVAASVVAVVGGTLGSLLLLMKRRSALPVLSASLVGVLLQDVALFLIVGRQAPLGPVPFVLQGIVLLIAVGLILLARRAAAKGWLR